MNLVSKRITVGGMHYGAPFDPPAVSKDSPLASLPPAPRASATLSWARVSGGRGGRWQVQWPMCASVE